MRATPPPFPSPFHHTLVVRGCGSGLFWCALLRTAPRLGVCRAGGCPGVSGVAAQSLWRGEKHFRKPPSSSPAHPARGALPLGPAPPRSPSGRAVGEAVRAPHAKGKGKVRRRGAAAAPFRGAPGRLGPELLAARRRRVRRRPRAQPGGRCLPCVPRVRARSLSRRVSPPPRTMRLLLDGKYI